MQQSRPHNRTRQILYEQEVMSFLKDFIYPKDQAQPHNPPETIEEIIEDVDGIWDDLDRFVKPVALRRKLLEGYLAGEREEDVLALVDVLGRMRYDDRDPMTAYMRKTELGIMTGLSHLYAKMNDKPTAVIDLDFSNMGGTNDFFRDLIAAAENVPAQDVDQKRAEAMTDKAAKVVAQIVLNEINKTDGEQSVILPMRAGGDELRIVCTDIDPKEYPEMQKRIHHQIEMAMARFGLMDHEHKKHPGNQLKCGFGAALSIQDLRDVDPNTYMEVADAKIAVEKLVLGHYRAGITLPSNLALGTTFLDRTHRKTDRDRTSQEILKQSVLIRHASYRRITDLAGTGADNSDPVRRLASIEAEMEASLWRMNYKEHDAYVSPIFKNEEAPFDLQENGFNPALLYMSVAEEYEWKLVRLLEQEGLDTDDYEMEMLHASLMGLTPLDPAAGVQMPRDMPRQFEIYMRDIQPHLDHLQHLLEEEDKSSATRRAGPVHEALRKAHKLPSELSAVAPISLGVAFHNLAGFNKVFGHDNANKVLRYLAQNILKNTLMDHGLNEDDYAIAHEGGGAFTILFKPIIESGKGDVKILGYQLMDSITRDIEHHVAMLSEERVDGFMKALGMVLLDDQVLRDHNMEVLGDLPDQKQREWMNGVHVTCLAWEADRVAWDNGQTRAGLHLHQMREALERQVEKDRALQEALFEYTGDCRSLMNAKKDPYAHDKPPVP